jgi:hypothetical protein
MTDSNRETDLMKQYVLSIYQPADGPAPPAEALATVMRDVSALIEETRAAGHRLSATSRAAG